VEASPELSLMARPGDGSVRGLHVALLALPGADASALKAVHAALVEAGALPRMLGSKLGKAATVGDAIEVDSTLEALPSALWDAVVVPGDAASGDARAIEFVRDQYRHCKPVMLLGDPTAVLEATGISLAMADGNPDPGLVQGTDPAADAQAFLSALGKRRHYARETDPPEV
jgi:catalase